jgi:hypothetical protein
MEKEKEKTIESKHSEESKAEHSNGLKTDQTRPGQTRSKQGKSKTKEPKSLTQALRPLQIPPQHQSVLNYTQSKHDS